MEIGVDIEQISRFKDKTLETNEHFLKKIFTEKELEYCFSDKNYAQHLCGKFCVKEAVIKALSAYNIFDITYKDIEVLNNEHKIPYIKVEKYPQYCYKVSISHTKDNAIAFVIVNNEKL